MPALRVNDALLIADQAFRPYRCVAWSLPEGNGEISLTIFDRTQTELARAALPGHLVCDQDKLVAELTHQRSRLSKQGLSLLPWQLS